MLNITIICMGKLKEQYLKDASTEYLKRLSAFCSFNIIEIQNQNTPENPSAAQIEQALALEGKKILEKIPSGSKTLAMCIEGNHMSSEDLSELITDTAVNETSSINFIIGSSFGLSDEVKNRANVKLSMSKMTFPHQLARIMLLEQIYRAFQISSGGKYHK